MYYYPKISYNGVAKQAKTYKNIKVICVFSISFNLLITSEGFLNFWFTIDIILRILYNNNKKVIFKTKVPNLSKNIYLIS